MKSYKICLRKTGEFRVKTSIGLSCQENPDLTYLSQLTAGNRTENSKHISYVELGGTCDALKIMINTQDTGAQPNPRLMISGTVTGDPARITWICVSDGLNSHVPATCRS